jgi:large subunit ribosomal protein L18
LRVENLGKMSFLRNLALKKKRRVLRNRKKLRSGCLFKNRVRVSVFRSLKFFYAQAIDDSRGITVIGMSSKELVGSGNKKEVSRKMGMIFSKKLFDNGISEIVFDRGAYLYHGRVKEFADGLRDGGLSF